MTLAALSCLALCYLGSSRLLTLSQPYFTTRHSFSIRLCPVSRLRSSIHTWQASLALRSRGLKLLRHLHPVASATLQIKPVRRPASCMCPHAADPQRLQSTTLKVRSPECPQP